MRTVRKEEVLAAVKASPDYVRPTEREQRFKPGDKVRVKFMDPVGHTRLPRYARGHVGTVCQHHGTFVFPDTVAHGRGERPQHVYNVRFEAQELWGEDVRSTHRVYLDLWDDYLVACT
jgi:hypothetical protein